MHTVSSIVLRRSAHCTCDAPSKIALRKEQSLNKIIEDGSRSKAIKPTLQEIRAASSFSGGREGIGSCSEHKHGHSSLLGHLQAGFEPLMTQLEKSMGLCLGYITGLHMRFDSICYNKDILG